MINKVFISGKLHSGPRSTTLSEDDTAVVFFELNYQVEGRKKDSSVRKAVVSCVAYGNKALAIYNHLLKFKSISDGGEYEGQQPYIFVEGSLQSRKMKVGDTRKLRIQEVNVEDLRIIPESITEEEYIKMITDVDKTTTVDA